MENKKKITFFVMVDNEDNYYAGNVGEAAKFIESYLEEMSDEESIEISVNRKDMTMKEIEALPEV